MNKLLAMALLTAGLPMSAMADGGVRGLEHVALTVPDLAQARTFFTDGLGCKSVLTLGPFKDDNGSWMADFIGTHPRAVMNIGVMQCGNASNIELMEISSPSQDKKFPDRDDLGASSLGFYVDDLNDSIKQVKAAGGALLGGVTSVGEGPLSGRSFIYVRAAWGQQIFLMNDGNGIAYSKQPDAVKIFSPADLPVK